ncbi:MAG: hypothetical protein QXJ51_03775 [Sulfolobales archaeon]
MIWFSYVTGPNGPSVRIIYTAVAYIGSRKEVELVGEFLKYRESFDVDILCINGYRDLYYLARIDPDLVDVLKNSGECALVISARTKAMGSR